MRNVQVTADGAGLRVGGVSGTQNLAASLDHVGSLPVEIGKHSARLCLCAACHLCLPAHGNDGSCEKETYENEALQQANPVPEMKYSMSDGKKGLVLRSA